MFQLFCFAALNFIAGVKFMIFLNYCYIDYCVCLLCILQSNVRTLFVSGLPMDVKPRELYLLCRAYKVSRMEFPDFPTQKRRMQPSIVRRWTCRYRTGF